MAAKKAIPPSSDELPFGAGAVDTPVDHRVTLTDPGASRRSREQREQNDRPSEPEGSGAHHAAGSGNAGSERERFERDTRDHQRPHPTDDNDRQGAPQQGSPEQGFGAPGQRRSNRAERRRRWQERRRRRRKGLPPLEGDQRGGDQRGAPQGETATLDGGARETHEQHDQRQGRPAPSELREVEGLFLLERANHGQLRLRQNEFLRSNDDVHVPPWMVQKFGLRDGALVTGRYRRGQGRNKWDLAELTKIDGRDPREVRNLPSFKGLTSIDPDFHYAVGDGSGEVTLKVIDLVCPVGRGQRGLIVAPPRSGKTVLLKQFAMAIEKLYPDVHLIVLLVDERPEEATDWKRSVERGEVFVSTNDERPEKHVDLAEVVWARCRRLVELGEDVVLLMDSITRLARAYNNVHGNSGKTMSGGVDTRALERPKQFFGSARNTETAGSLTILGTTLVDTGSRMDQVIFEEFKGTGNMELVLSRKLADRRIFPAIDLEKTGTRKDEKLHSARRLARVNTLRRVLMRMHWAEAMELLVAKLLDVEKIDDFLARFDVDPDAGDEGKQAVSPVRMRW